MAKGKKTGGRDMKKGETVNPNGRPKLSEEAKAVKKMTSEQAITIFSKLIAATPKDLVEMANKEDASFLEKCVAVVAKKALETGDISRLEFLLNRSIGPVKQKIDHTSSDKSMSPNLDGKTKEELLARAKELVDKLNK